ncbi:Hypothetical_protein [Hexamita inflata]|uniref:Hypothetical_protein n=1 Tax=Hexamita inflata TaxID=28002 RepID=A0AA86V4K4_9EUKA|nr:Hypothetical protein HINF_LOCUS44283 [Hexamita inflata]
MFKYDQSGSYLQITTRCSNFWSDCQNNFSQFLNKQFEQVNIFGKIYQQKNLEFILQSYRMRIHTVIIDHCTIDFSEASGDFNQIIFNSCDLINELTDKFTAVQLTFNSNLTFSQLKNFSAQKINVSANTNCKIDFEGASELNSLNELTIIGTEINLNQLKGNWKQVKIEHCQLANWLSEEFYTDIFSILSRNQQTLVYLCFFHFNELIINLRQDKELFECEPLKQLKWKSLKLTLSHMKVDIQQLTGRFDELTLNQCTIQNNGTDKLSCKQLNVLHCKKHLDTFNTDAFYKTNCKSMNIQQCSVVDYLPLNLQELHVDNCEVKLKNKCQHLQKITLKSVDKIKQMDMCLLPVLVEITSDCKSDNVKHIQNVIKTRRKYQTMMQTNTKRIEKLTVKRDSKYSHLDELDTEFFYCNDVIMDNFQGGTE